MKIASRRAKCLFSDERFQRPSPEPAMNVMTSAPGVVGHAYGVFGREVR